MSVKPQTIYYETTRSGLVPVKFLGWKLSPLGLGYNAVIQFKRDVPAVNGGLLYYRGERVAMPPKSIVVKAGRRDYHQQVKPAQLPARTDGNTISDTM